MGWNLLVLIVQFTLKGKNLPSFLKKEESSTFIHQHIFKKVQQNLGASIF